MILIFQYAYQTANKQAKQCPLWFIIFLPTLTFHEKLKKCKIVRNQANRKQ